MKKVILVSFVSALIFMACSNGETQIDELKEQRDSLRTEMTQLTKQLTKVESKIQALDSTKTLTQVTVQEVSLSNFEHYFEVFGSVEAPENTLLSAQTAGEILSIAVKEGQSVKKGQILLNIDANTIRKNMDEVENSLSLATDVFKRQERLWEKNIGSELQYLEAKNNKQSLEKRLETLEAQLNMATVKAPFSGVVDQIMPNVGEMASPGMPLIRLVNLDNIYIKADVSERHLGTITEGTKTIVEFTQLGLTIDTAITRTGNYINPGNRTFTARVDIENKDNRIKPNLMAKLKLRDLYRDSVVTLASDLIQQTPSGESFVYVATGKSGDVEVSKRVIEIGESNSKLETLVKAGLKAGEVVVDRGARSIKEGQQVTVVEK